MDYGLFGVRFLFFRYKKWSCCSSRLSIYFCNSPILNRQNVCDNRLFEGKEDENEGDVCTSRGQGGNLDQNRLG